MARKTDIRTLRKILAQLGVTIYREGGNWIHSAYNSETKCSHLSPMHFTIKSEREALEVALEKAAERAEAKKAQEEFYASLP